MLGARRMRHIWACVLLAGSLCPPAASAVPQAGSGLSEPQGVAESEASDAGPGSWRRVFDPQTPWHARLYLAYTHPLVAILAFSPEAAGPTGELLLPGARRFRSELTFSILANNRRLGLIPGQNQATLTLVSAPPQMREDWAWPDGLTLTRVCFQPLGARGVGVHFEVKNQTARPVNGLRLVGSLRDPELGDRLERNQRQENDDELFADPRGEILYLRDSETREESWLALGWGPQGGLMSGGEPGQALAGGLGREESGLVVNLETPAWDLLPGQTHAADFWILWDYDQDGVTHDLLNLRQHPGYTVWDNRRRTAKASGMSFTCQDGDLDYLAQALKSWAPWVLRQDALGMPFINANTDTEPVSPRELAVGAAGLAWLGRAPQVRDCLDAWLDQRLEITDIASGVLALEAYVRATQDWVWLRERGEYLEELFNSLQHYDVNGDGLPEYSGAVPPDADDYNPFYARRASVRRSVQSLQHVLTAVRAYQAGAKLFTRLGDQASRLKASRCQLLAEQGERTLDEVFWRPGLGRAGYYACARLPFTGELAEHRSAAALEALAGTLGSSEHRARVFTELWTEEAWRTPQERCRSLPRDDSDYNGDQVPGRGLGSVYRTHELLQWALRNPETSTAAVTRLKAYAHEVILDPKTLGFFPTGDGSGGGLEISQFNFLEILVRGLAGLQPDLEGLRITIPRYEQDLGVRIRNLPYGKTKISVSVQGPGGTVGGKIFVNGEPVVEGDLIPRRFLEHKRVEIVINRVLD